MAKGAKRRRKRFPRDAEIIAILPRTWAHPQGQEAEATQKTALNANVGPIKVRCEARFLG